MKQKTFLASLLALVLLSLTANAAGELVRIVRNKLSAGDLASGIHAVEDYKRQHGVDAEYLEAVGWLARGAEMLNQTDAAAGFVAELRREIKEEKQEWMAALGAAIEVEGKLRARREGRGSAISFLETEFAKAKNLSLKSRIRKNINLLSLEGQSAPELNLSDYIGPKPESFAKLKGKPVLLFLWAQWCGDCRAQAASLARITEKYHAQGLVVMAPTRYYGSGAGDKPATPAEEKAHVEKVWKETYPGLESVPVVLDTDGMIRYGVSATPTFALIDRKGIVRFYSPTRMAESELSRRIEAVLAETP